MEELQNRYVLPWHLVAAAVLMIIFGLVEVVTGFTHGFFGISTANGGALGYLSVFVGLCYCAAGLLLFPMKKRLAVMAVVLLIIDTAGRIILVTKGFYPVGTVKQTVSIIAGTVIAGLFAVYIMVNRKKYA